MGGGSSRSFDCCLSFPVWQSGQFERTLIIADEGSEAAEEPAADASDDDSEDSSDDEYE